MESYHSIQSFSHVRSQSAWPPHWVAEAILATGRNQRGSKDPHCPTPKPSKIPRWCKLWWIFEKEAAVLTHWKRCHFVCSSSHKRLPSCNRSVCALGKKRPRNWISLECSIYHFSHLSSIYCSRNYQTFVKSLGGGPTNRTALGLFWHWQTSSKIVARRNSCNSIYDIFSLPSCLGSTSTQCW